MLIVNYKDLLDYKNLCNFRPLNANSRNSTSLNIHLMVCLFADAKVNLT